MELTFFLFNYTLQCINLRRKGRGENIEATAKDLRFHSKKLIESVRQGEEVVITYRGTPCARLMPYQDENITGKQHKLFGM